MRKSLLLILALLLITLSACGKGDKPNEQSKSDDSSASTVKDTNSDTDFNFGEGTASFEAVTETQEPIAAPTPTPYPTDDIKEYDNYGFTYSEKVQLKNEPHDDGFVHKELEKGTELHMTGNAGDGWYMVEADGLQGFIKRSEIATAKGYINADEVRLRAEASTSSDVKSEMAQQTELVVISRSDDWYKVVLAGDMQEGYVHIDYVSYFDGYITADDVRLREAPNTECETKTRIEQGKKVSIITEYNGWYKVSVGEYTGYMSKDYIEYSPSVKKVDKERGYLLENGVNFREGPSTECLSLGKLAKFAPVYITGETDEWYRVLYNEKEGYISRDFVEKGRLLVYVTAQDVNLRAGPGTDTDLLTKVRQNSKFEIIGSSGEWLKGVVNQNTGYIRSDYLSDTTVNGGKKTNEFTSAEIALAAKVVYLEARGYGTEAYRAVANVIYNRVKSHRFPNTVKGVVFQSGQFSVTWSSKFDSTSPSSEAYEATKDVLNGGIRPLPFNVLFFHASYLGRSWGSEKQFYKTIGDNSFFRYVG